MLNRLVTIFLETAELRVMEGRDLTLSFWRNNVDQLLNFQSKPVLQGYGTISSAEMERIAKERYEAFNQQRKQKALQAANAEDLEELKNLEEELKHRSHSS